MSEAETALVGTGALGKSIQGGRRQSGPWASKAWDLEATRSAADGIQHDTLWAKGITAWRERGRLLRNLVAEIFLARRRVEEVMFKDAESKVGLSGEEKVKAKEL